MKSSDYLSNIFGCSGRTAVVTGASSGLGAEMARALAKAGANVLLVARRTERLQQLATELADTEGEIIPCTADLSQRDDIKRVAEQADKDLGGCDILVANAGTADRVPLKSMEEEDFNGVLDLNVTAQWLLSKALFSQLAASGNGRIINIASIYSMGASVIHGLGAYTISKHALVGLTKSQAVEWARHGITANAIAPAYFPTELTETALEDEDMSARLRTFTPQDRFGDPSELAPALLFLASKASAYTTGAIVPVDGGWTAW
ncbi:MAG: NAD(P)-dependent dehydrogenase (short-subunit alcohol dehydrogenase family) [Candidatus Latescibacterota bacterium]|jgi:NAD(P)-dependent dehydrogenase (short-subunit alcohol dehydrogenase family)